MVQVPQVSPSTLLIGMPLIVSGELSYICRERNALVERCRQTEHLERRTRLQPALGEVEAGAVGAAVVGAHPTGTWVDGNHCGPQLLVLTLHVVAHRVDRRGLRLRIDGRGDLQALGVERPAR